jgi:hypothetical protein
MHCFFHSLVAGKVVASQSIFDLTKQATVRRSQIRTIQKMLQHLKVQLSAAFNGVGGSVRMSSVM